MVLGITQDLCADVPDSLLTAFDFKGARLCVQGKSAEVHVAHCSHCNPTNKKTKPKFSEAAKYKCKMINRKGLCFLPV